MVARSRIMKLFIVFLAILFSLGICEIYLRLSTVQETKRLAIYDKALGWRGKPHGEGEYIVRKAKVRADYRYNNLGFRDDEVYAKEDDSHRILLLGDSFVESIELDFESIFPKVLEKEMQEAFDKSYEVVILGCQGYSTAQELLAFRKYKETIDPDIVLLVFFTGNDYEDNLRRQFAYLDEDGHLKFNKNEDSAMRIKYLTFKRWLYEHCHLVFYLKNLMVSKMNIKIVDSAKATASHESKEYMYDITRLLISKMSEEVEQEAEFGVVIIPTKEEIEEKRRERIDTVVEILDRKEIPYLDLYYTLGEDDYLEYDKHFNKRGHSVVAKKMLEFVSERFEM